MVLMDWLGLSDLSSYKERRVYRGAFLFSPTAECTFFPLNRSELPPAFFPVKFFPVLFPLFPKRFPVLIVDSADSPYFFRLFPVFFIRYICFYCISHTSVLSSLFWAH